MCTHNVEPSSRKMTRFRAQALPLPAQQPGELPAHIRRFLGVFKR